VAGAYALIFWISIDCPKSAECCNDCDLNVKWLAPWLTSHINSCGSGVAEKSVVLCLNLKQVLNNVIIMMDAPLHVLN
jgi:hypothetical protein